MEEFLKVLEGLDLDIDFASEKNLVGDGVLSSLDIVSLIAELSDAYEVKIPAKEIVPVNFNSAEAMYAMIQRLLDE